MITTQETIGHSKLGAWLHKPSTLRWCVAIGFSIPLLLLISRTAVNVPFKDEYQFNQLFNSLAHGSLPGPAVLLAAHNGHPCLILKLLMAGVLAAKLPWSVLMYGQVPLLALTFLTAATHVEVRPVIWRRFMVLGLAMLILTAHDWENLYWGMQIAFTLTICTSVASFHYASKYANASNTTALVLALILGVAAVLSSGAGIIGFVLMVGSLAYLSMRRKRTNLILVLLFGVTGLGLFFTSQILALRRPLRPHDVSLRVAFDQVTRMFANSVIALDLTNPFAIVLGIALIIASLWCGISMIGRWRAHLFELLLLGLGTCIIFGITYERLRHGVYQPNASRYVVLVAPVVISCVLFYAAQRRKVVIVLLLAVIAFGYAKSIASEWRLAPYRRANLTAELGELCTHGKAHDLSRSKEDVQSIQHFFCARSGRN